MLLSRGPGEEGGGRGEGGGGGDSNIKKVGVLVVSLRGVNFRFWSRLGFNFKILDEHPHPYLFNIRVPPPPLWARGTPAVVRDTGHANLWWLLFD